MQRENRVIIVTGGAYGIGRAIVRRFAREGASVLIADCDERRGRELQDNTPNAIFKQTDVRHEDQIQSLVDFSLATFGRIDVVCSNAGIERYARADQYSARDWADITDTNLRAGFLLVKHAYSSLAANKGCVVFVSSVQAIANEERIAVYAASKAGLLGLVRGMAVDFAPEGVRVNAVCPGATMTGMMEVALAGEADGGATLHSLSQRIPLRRIAVPEDVANAVAFLASSEASYITGTHLVVDGGVLARLAL